MKNKALFSAILAGLMLAGTLAACGAKNDAPAAAGTTASPAATSAPEETTLPGREGTRDNLPDTLNFNGATVRVLYRNGAVDKYDLVGTDNIGDYVTDGVWERNRSVEDRLNVTIEAIPTANGGLNDVRNELKNLLLTGSAEQDFFLTTGNSIIQAEVNGYLYDMAKVPHIDLAQPWWWDDAIDQLSIDGKIFNYLVGDMMLTNYQKMGVIYYNKAIYEDLYGDPDKPYADVVDGVWTVDRFSELSAGAYVNMNGDTKRGDGDRFGFIISKTKQESDIHFLIGCDLSFFKRDADGNVTIDMNNDRVLTAVESLQKLYTENAGAFNSTLAMDASSAFFADTTALFYPSRLSAALTEDLRAMEDPYGILPYPKLDEDQKNYVSLIHSSSGVVCVPRTAPKERIEMIGAVIEALSAQSYRTVVTPFLDTALKLKYSQDTMSGQVIDLVIAGACKDFIFEYSPQTNNIIMTPLNHMYGSANFSSAYASGLQAAQTKLDNFVAQVRAALAE